MDEKRDIEINNFFRITENAYLQNNDLELNHYVIYSLLSKYGYEEKELEQLNDSSLNFIEEFKEYFKKNKNLEIQSDNYNIYFFNNRKNSRAIKIYLSFDKSHVLKSSCKIFKYLLNRNMDFEGKISNKVSSFNVIIRLYSIEDVIRISDYITNDNELSLSANLCHPFSFRKGILSLSYDGVLSYNKTLSYIITSYLQDKKHIKNLSLKDFLKYTKSMYEEIFTSGKSTIDFINSKTFLNEKKLFENTKDELKEYMLMFDVIIFELNVNITFNNFLNFVKSLESEEYLENIDKKVLNVLAKNDILENDGLSSKLSTNDILESYVKYGNLKYGSDKVVDYLEKFKETNNYAYITRENDFRDLFRKNITLDKLEEIPFCDIQSYVNNILGISTQIIDEKDEVVKDKDENVKDKDETFDCKKISCDKKQDSECLNAIDSIANESINGNTITGVRNEIRDDDLYNLFIDACQATYDKYGGEQLRKALYNAINKNIYGYFTNGNKHYRDKLINYITVEMMKKYIVTFMDKNGLDSKSSTLKDFYALFEKK